MTGQAALHTGHHHGIRASGTTGDLCTAAEPPGTERCEWVIAPHATQRELRPWSRQVAGPRAFSALSSQARSRAHCPGIGPPRRRRVRVCVRCRALRARADDGRTSSQGSKGPTTHAEDRYRVTWALLHSCNPWCDPVLTRPTSCRSCLCVSLRLLRQSRRPSPVALSALRTQHAHAHSGHRHTLHVSSLATAVSISKLDCRPRLCLSLYLSSLQVSTSPFFTKHVSTLSVSLLATPAPSTSRYMGASHSIAWLLPPHANDTFSVI